MGMKDERGRKRMKIAVIDDERSARNELIYQILHTMPESEISEADSGSSARVASTISRPIYWLNIARRFSSST